MQHNFHDSKVRGDQGEAIVKRWLERRGNKITPAPEHLQRLGIDFTIDNDGLITTAEVKYDEAAQRTGNVFIETYSNEETGRLGWYYTSKANLLFYLVAPGTLYVASMKDLRDSAITTIPEARLRRVPNNRNGSVYHTSGYIIPTRHFAGACKWQFSVFT